MGWFSCGLENVALLAAVARNFCPFPDYSPGPLFNMLSVNSSLHLSEHYAAVQASLTPQQQQDFTRTLRSTFGQEGKVSYGGVGIVALSLAVLFDTVARQVKGEYVSDQEPIPGLFHRDTRGTYPPSVNTLSKYLRLVPHIANNPTRMRDETEKYLLELKQAGNQAVQTIYAAEQYEDITGKNLMKSYLMGKNMVLHLNRISNKTIDPEDYMPRQNKTKDPKIILNLNCDPKEASDRFLAKVDSFDERTKEAFKNCKLSGEEQSVIEKIAYMDWFFTILTVVSMFDRPGIVLQTDDFDLKANALGKWI